VIAYENCTYSTGISIKASMASAGTLRAGEVVASKVDKTVRCIQV